MEVNSLYELREFCKSMEEYDFDIVSFMWDTMCKYEEKITKLKSKLEELRKTAIVPKFKIGDEIYVIFNEKEIKNFTIRIIESISDKSGIKFIYTTNTWKENGGTCSLSSDYNKFYKTKQGAKMAFKRLNRE